MICVAFHPDGRHVVSGGADGQARVWDLTGRLPSRVFAGTAGSVHCVAVSADGHLLAAGDAGGGLRLWDLETNRERVLLGHKSGLRSVAFGPEQSGSQLLSCESDGVILRWDTSTGVRKPPILHRRAEEPTAAVTVNRGAEPFGGTQACYALDGKVIVSGGQDQWVMIWDAVTGRLLDQVPIGTNIYGLSISLGRARELALAEQLPGIEILDLEKPHEPRRSLRSLSNRATVVSFSPGGRTLATAGYGVVGLLNAQNGQILDVFNHANNSPFSLAFGPDGRMLAMALGDEIRVVHAVRDHEGTTLAARLGPIRRLAVSPDERLLALALEDGSIVIWDVATAQPLQPLSGHRLMVFDLAFLPLSNSLLLVSVGGDGAVKIWNPKVGGGPLRTLHDSGGPIYSVVVRPDGRQIAAGGQAGIVYTWNTATWQFDLSPIEHGASVSALAYDPGSTVLASGGMDSAVQVWSAVSGRRRHGTTFPPTPTHRPRVQPGRSVSGRIGGCGRTSGHRQDLARMERFPLFGDRVPTRGGCAQLQSRWPTDRDVRLGCGRPDMGCHRRTRNAVADRAY